MKLTIEPLRGVWRAQLDGRTYFSDTLEDLLYQLAPDAPPAYHYHAGELLGGVLGAEVVEVEPDEDYSDLFSALFECLLRPDSWQPTDEQRAYFEAMEDDGA